MSIYLKLLKVKKYIPNNIKELAKEILLAKRTNENRVLPNFIIAGVQKGGTTSLFTYLMQHPQVAPPLHKQTFYFDRYYNKPLKYYKAAFPKADEIKRQAKITGKIIITGEATPDYFYDADVPKRIQQSGLDAKYIIIYREPYARCISSYNYFSEYYEGDKTIDEYFRMEINAYRQYYLANTTYEELYQNFDKYPIISRSLYDLQFNHWSIFFKRENMCFVSTEDLNKTPNEVLETTTNFLGIDNIIFKEFPRYNITKRKKEKLSKELEVELKELLDLHWNNFLSKIK